MPRGTVPALTSPELAYHGVERPGYASSRNVTAGPSTCTLAGDEMPQPTYNDQPVFDPLRRLRADWPQRGWSWDSRVACVSSSFSVDLESNNRLLALGALPTEFTARSISSAPPAYREVCDRAGGLRSGQLFFAGPAVGRIFAYGLWWPWGDGMTISLRVGLGGVDESHELMNKLRDVFGVSL